MITNKLVVIKHKRKLIGIAFNQNNELMNNEFYEVASIPLLRKKHGLSCIASQITAAMDNLACNKLILQTDIICEDYSSLIEVLCEVGVDLTCVHQKLTNKYNFEIARLLSQTNLAYNVPYVIPEGIAIGGDEARYFRTAKIVCAIAENICKMELFVEREMMAFHPVVYLGGKLRLDLKAVYSNTLLLMSNTLNVLYGRVYAPDVIENNVHPLAHRILKLLRAYFKYDRSAILESIKPWIASGYTLSDYLKSLNNFDSSVICELTLGVFSPPVDTTVVSSLKINEDAVSRIERYYDDRRKDSLNEAAKSFVEQGIKVDNEFVKSIELNKLRGGESNTTFVTPFLLNKDDSGNQLPIYVVKSDNDDNEN